MLLTAMTFTINSQMTSVVEENKNAEAALKAAGSQLRALGEHDPILAQSDDNRRLIVVALDHVIAHWRALCWQMIRITLLSHANMLIAPSIGLLFCAPKYIAGTMHLGDVVQAGAAFVAVQTAFGWAADNYGRLCEWAASASRVGSLLSSLDIIETFGSGATNAHPALARAGGLRIGSASTIQKVLEAPTFSMSMARDHDHPTGVTNTMV
jgi:putative ATP-binding cassette transporter